MTLHTVSTSKSTYSSAFTSFFISPICMTRMNFLNRFLQCLGKNQECDVQFTLVFYFETLNDSSEKQVCTFHIFSQVRWYALLSRNNHSRPCSRYCLLKPFTKFSQSLHRLRIFSVNLTKSAVSCRFGHIYWINP